MDDGNASVDFLDLLNVDKIMVQTAVKCPEAVRKRIREAKLYLKLLTTIGSVEFIKWLPQAKTEGQYYIFDNFKIAKRPVHHKEAVNLREVPGVIDAVEHCLKLADMPQIVMMSEATKLGIDWKAANGLIPVLSLALKGISNVVSRCDASPGDIFRTDVSMAGAADVDLINLYMIQEHLSDRSLAVDLLCDMFHIPDGIYEDVDIDRERRWLYRRQPKALMYAGSQNQYEYVDFYENDLLLGRVAYHDGQEIGPLTYWSKRPETPSKPLYIPFPAPSPLWNLNQIRKNPHAPVLLIASPLAAHRVDQFSEDKITELHGKISLIRARESRLYTFHNGDNEFTNGVYEYVRKKITDQVSNYSEQQKSEILYRYNYTYWGPACNMFTARELYQDPKAFNSPGFWDIAYFECSNVYGATAAEVVQNVRVKKNNSALNKAFYDYPTIKLFRSCYEAIIEFVNQKKQQDNREIAELEQQIRKLEERNARFVVSSWYGGIDAVQDVAWNTLRGRVVYLFLPSVCPEQLELGLTLESRLTKESIKLNFVTYEENEFKKISEEDFHRLAEKDHVALPPKAEEIAVPRHKEDQLQSFDLNDNKRPKMNSKYVVFPIIEEHSITLLYSQEGLGKTLVAMSIALAASSGVKVFGDSFSNAWTAKEPVPVLYVDGEMSEQNFRERLCNFSEFYKKQCPDLKTQIPFHYKLLEGKGWDLSSHESQREQITKWVQAFDVRLLILDNLSTLTNFAETTRSWQNIFSWLKDLAAHNCAILLIHHAGKSGEQQRGSGAKTITVDNVIRLQHALGENVKRGVAINVQVEKGRNIPSEFKIPFNIMLKTEKDTNGDQTFKWGRTTSKAQGKEISTSERNAALFQASKSQAFNQQILADYFGIDVRQVKTILAQQEELEQQRVEKTAQQIIDTFEIADTPTKRRKNKITRMINGILRGTTKTDDDPEEQEK